MTAELFLRANPDVAGELADRVLDLARTGLAPAAAETPGAALIRAVADEVAEMLAWSDLGETALAAIHLGQLTCPYCGGAGTVREPASWGARPGALEPAEPLTPCPLCRGER